MRARVENKGEPEPRRRPVLGLLGRASLTLTSLLPRQVAYFLGGALGWLVSFLPLRERRATRVNLGLCFPELSPAQRGRLARRSFMEAGRTMLALGGLWKWERARFERLLESVQGEDVVDAAIAAGKGIIVAVPHLGGWELAGFPLSQRCPTVALYRRPRVRELDRVYTAARERFGARLVPAGAGGVRALQRALRAGEAAIVLPDQDPGRGAGVFVPFFGHPANTSTLLPRLAHRSGAAVLFAWAERLPGGRFRCHYVPGSPEISGPDPVAGAAAVNRDVERCVREAPAQYLWSYKRFRVQPERGRSPYKRAR
jgi:KDO2-lipid IV(A) lauroyltransferase